MMTFQNELPRPGRSASTILVDFERRLRALAFGVYPVAAIAAKTLPRVPSVTCAGAASERLTVAVDTPARRATSKMVTAARRVSRDFEGRSLLIPRAFSFTLPKPTGVCNKEPLMPPLPLVARVATAERPVPQRLPNAIDIGDVWNRIDVNDYKTSTDGSRSKRVSRARFGALKRE